MKNGSRWRVQREEEEEEEELSHKFTRIIFR